MSLFMSHLSHSRSKDCGLESTTPVHGLSCSVIVQVSQPPGSQDIKKPMSFGKDEVRNIFLVQWKYNN